MRGTGPEMRLGGTRSPDRPRRPASLRWTRSCARSAIAARTANPGLHIQPLPPILIQVFQYQVEFEYGPARQLEGLFAAIAGDLPDRTFSRHVRIREHRLHPAEQQTRQP